MKRLVIEKNINYCNECPYCRKFEDTSICEDSFDEPNFNYYCKHPSLEKEILIGVCFNRNQKQEIPKTCPL